MWYDSLIVYFGKIFEMGRGGKREGAGRKIAGYVKVSKSPRVRTPVEIKDKECPKCSAVFTPLRGGNKRVLCFACAPNEKDRERHKNDGVCQTCEKPLIGFPKRARYCSSECKRVANLHMMKMRAIRLDSKDRAPRPCAHCGKLFEVPYRSNRTTYCSKQCRTRAHAGSGCCHRRRARKFGVEYQYIHKHKVFVRDGWKCRICGVDTPKELKGTREDNAPELDHIIPLSKGGPHLYSNVQLACKKCNMTKGARHG